MIIGRPGRRTVRALLAAAIAVAPLLTATGARADSVPADPQAHGFIGLCDRHDQPVMSGQVSAAPFVWKAVASQPPPKEYLGKGQNAVLDIYQPRPGVDAGEWSADQLTAATFYSVSAAPVAQATLKDIPLAVIVKEFPPMLDGLYELRMYFGKADRGLYSQTYPATFIRVTGDHWYVVKGGRVNCAAASGESTEVLTGTVSRQAAYGATPPRPARGRPTAVATTASRPPASSAPDDRTATADAGSAGSTTPAAADGGAPSQASTATSSTSGSSAAWWLIPLLAVLVLGAGVIARRRIANRAP